VISLGGAQLASSAQILQGQISNSHAQLVITALRDLKIN